MLAQKELERVEDFLFDPETGEVIEQDRTIVIEDLPKMLRSLRAIERRKEMILDYLKTEVERLTHACNRKMEGLNNSREYLASRAEVLLSETGQRKLEYPGLGVVRYRKKPDTVSTEGWDEMDETTRAKYTDSHYSLFKITRIVKPIKAEIKKRLPDDNSVVALKDAFEIKTGETVFEFKPEE